MLFKLRRITHLMIKTSHGKPARFVAWSVAAILVSLAAAAYGLALWRVPLWTHAKSSQDRYDARVLVVSIGGAVVVGLGLLYTARSYRLSRRGQVTDRFTQALERLASDEIYVRIGGIYALEQVLRDSPSHHSDVLAVLKAFISRRTPTDWAASSNDPPTDLSSAGKTILPDRPDEDVQAALNTLGRRPLRPEKVIDLSGTYLAGARLNDADLTVFDFSRANLAGAWFVGANLSDAWLIDADLSGARLSNADMAHAQFVGADLSGANLLNANLSGTGFERASLANADLRDANLCDANLEKADLTEAIVGLNPKWIPPGWQLDVSSGRLTALTESEPIDGGQITILESTKAEVPHQRPASNPGKIGRPAHDIPS